MTTFIKNILVILYTISLASCSSNLNLTLNKSVDDEISNLKFERDRDAILKIAGNFKVKFRFEETISLMSDYEIKEPYITSAYEVIKVIEDMGDKITLQHILVANAKNKQFAIKHWRQDWKYEPHNVLVFIGGNAWNTKEVKPKDRVGSWSQTVYQVDDSPRYGAIGKWSHQSGVSEWVPSPEWRPLPRRDMTKRNDYHAIKAINRHVITPNGWVHEEDNSKLVLKNGSQILAREIGINSYTRSNEFESTVAYQYLDDTELFWKEIRKIWKKLEDEPNGFRLTLKGEPEELYISLLEKAEEYLNELITLDKALNDANLIIEKYTTQNLGTLESRLR